MSKIPQMIRAAIAGIVSFLFVASLAANEPSFLRFDIRDVDNKPLPCRIHLFDSANKPVKPDGYPAWNDHFVCSGSADLVLPPDTYHYELEHGPEY